MAQLHFAGTRRWLLPAMLVLPAALLLCLGIFAHLSVRALHQESLSALAAENLKEVNEQVLRCLLDNETGQRGYVLTQDERFLEPYTRSLHELPEHWKILADGATEPTLQAALPTLRRAIDERLAFAAHTVALQQQGNHAESHRLVASGQGKALMDRARVAAADFEQRVQRLVDTRADALQHALTRSERVSWLLLAGYLLLAGGAATLFYRLQRERELLRVCAWSKTVEYQGEWISFEEYLSRQFNISTSHGISPAEAERVMAEFRQKASGQESKVA